MKSFRRVQRTPGGTFFVCVPKKWANRVGLERGSLIGVEENSEGKLVITPEGLLETAHRSISLDTGPYLNREIVGNYLLGFDNIRIESKDHISSETRTTVKKALDRLIGLEIVEEDYSSIVLQCLLEPSSFPPEKILRRAYAISQGMLRDVINALVAGNVQLAGSVMARDGEENRLYFLLVRILRTIVQNPALSEKLGVTPIECLDFRQVASLVEATGDECVRVAQKVLEMKGVQLDNASRRLLTDYHLACYDAHRNAINSFFTGNIEEAEHVRRMRQKLERTFSSIERIARAQSLEIMPQILAVAAFLRQTYEHSVDIADLVVPKGRLT